MTEPIQDVIGLTIDDPRVASALGTDRPLEPDRIGDRTYVELPDLGVSLVLLDHRHVATIQLYAEGHEGYRQFSGQLPLEIGFEMSREELRARLGAPLASDEGVAIAGLGQMPAWDKWDLSKHTVHAEYWPSLDGVRLFSLEAG